MKRLKVFTTFALCVLTAFAVLWSPRGAQSQITSTSQVAFYFPITGVAVGESARLNVSNITGLPGGVNPGPCRVSMTLLDTAGNVTSQSGLMDLAAGQSSALVEPGPRFSLTGTGSVVAPNLRRAAVIVTVPLDSTIGSVNPGPCRPSLEVFDNLTGRTSVVQTFSSDPGWSNRNETLVLDSDPALR